MDGEGDARAALEPYRLQGVQEHGKEVGKGSFATVVEVDYKGLRCVGKKIRRQFHERDTEDLIRYFDDECELLSQLQHPHIVQFMGIYFELDTNLPVLVMEFLPTTLAQCIDQYGILPKETAYSIVRDVILGLRYLHEMPQPILHCNLTANNVLLTGDLKAKISDVSSLPSVAFSERTPQTQSYMPPEVQGPDPRYSTKVDIFSYGVILVHVFCGNWPLPAADEVIFNGHLDKYLRSIGRQHPLMQLIVQCLSTSPDLRPEAVGVLRQVNKVVSKFPPCFNNKLEMLQKANQFSPFTPGAKLEWNECTSLPIGMSDAQTVSINGQVYIGGGTTDGDTTRSLVFRYNPVVDKWITLPPAPMHYFSLGHLMGKLVLIGGIVTSTERYTADIHTFDEEYQLWVKNIPPMSTPRVASAVICHSSALIVCGGIAEDHVVLASVEVFDSVTSRWYAASPLPSPRYKLSSAVIGDTCFLVGGCKTQGAHCDAKHSVLSASINSILESETSRSEQSQSVPVWRALANVPHYHSTAAILGGCLLAVGGKNKDDFMKGKPKPSVYAYSPVSACWVHIGDLPLPRCWCSTALLPTGELMVIGGGEKNRDNWTTNCCASVFKGRIHL